MTKCDCCREGNNLAMAQFLLGISGDLAGVEKLTLCRQCVDVLYQIVHNKFREKEAI